MKNDPRASSELNAERRKLVLQAIDASGDSGARIPEIAAALQMTADAARWHAMRLRCDGLTVLVGRGPLARWYPVASVRERLARAEVARAQEAMAARVARQFARDAARRTAVLAARAEREAQEEAELFGPDDDPIVRRVAPAWSVPVPRGLVRSVFDLGAAA